MVSVQTQTVGILGGMGPAAGADFVRLFVDACREWLAGHGLPVQDQNFPEHWLAQVPVPDRSTALRTQGPGMHQPLEPMLQAVGRLAALGAQAIAVACNTAHVWLPAMRERFPRPELLDVTQEVTEALRRDGVTRVGLLATEGTYRSGLYNRALEPAGIACIVPDGPGQLLLMRGIYGGVKAGDLPLARRCFVDVARRLIERDAPQRLILACTEIPLALRAEDVSVPLIDPAQVLARALARRAYGEVPQR